MAQAVAPFAPPANDSPDWFRRVLRQRDAEWQSLLRLPFEVEFETPATYGLAPEVSEPASSRYVVADEEDVVAAVDALIDRHIVELEADVKRRMLLRRDAEMQP
jgi:hypothetical protein